MSELTRKYSDTEYKLFREEYALITALEEWKNSPVVLLKASELAAFDEPLQLALVVGAAEPPTKRGRN